MKRTNLEFCCPQIAVIFADLVSGIIDINFRGLDSLFLNHMGGNRNLFNIDDLRYIGLNSWCFLINQDEFPCLFVFWLLGNTLWNFVEIFVQLCGIAFTQKTQNKDVYLAKTQRRESIVVWDVFSRTRFVGKVLSIDFCRWIEMNFIVYFFFGFLEILCETLWKSLCSFVE